jgi:hypothetical protein
MPVYYMVLDGDWFEQEMVPALTASWQQRSFEPCRTLCTALLPAAQSFAVQYHTGSEQPMLALAAQGISFDRRYWQLLVGEILLFAAAEIPEIQICPETLCCLLAPDHSERHAVSLEQAVPIQQAHFGSRDLLFGPRPYRPGHVGYNNRDDVCRLLAYLDAQQPDRWTPTPLQALPNLADDEERGEELAFAREWFPALQGMYRRAQDRGQVIVCELL